MFPLQVSAGKTWNELQKFKHYLTKRSNPYKRYKVNKILEVYSWFVLPRYRKKGLSVKKKKYEQRYYS